jgi:xanthine dehydrogenase accessory factor
LIDAILAKRNLGTHRAMADHTIALGPGFEAGVDVDLVIETMRGHNLGRIITHGTALPNTGIPGLIAGHAQDRVVHASRAGIIHLHAKIGDIVQKHARLASIHDASGSYPVTAPIAGIVRGLIRNEFDVFQGMKIADVDPRIKEQGNCFTISDKARCIGGSALTALLQLNTQLPLLKAHQQD